MKALFVLLLVTICVLCAAADTRTAERRWRDDGDVNMHTAPDSHGTRSTMIPRHPVMPIRPPMKMRVIPTRNLTNIFMRALESHNVLLLMALVDQDTVISAPTDLPFGGLYKGRRGLLELGERCLRSMRVLNSTYKIVNVDEDRGTASVLCTKTGVVRRTGTTVTTRSVLSLKFTLNKLSCMDVIELDHARLHQAYRTSGEKWWTRLRETWFEHGTDHNLMNMIANNVTFKFGASTPKNLLTVRGKDEVLKHIKHVDTHAAEGTDACKLLHCLYNHTEIQLILHSDDNRVVTVNFAGEGVIHDMFEFNRHTEGTVFAGTSRIGHFVVYYEVFDFDNSGKLDRMLVHVNRPITLLDRVYLRNKYGITIHAEESE